MSSFQNERENWLLSWIRNKNVACFDFCMKLGIPTQWNHRQHKLIAIFPPFNVCLYVHLYAIKRPALIMDQREQIQEQKMSRNSSWTI